MKSVFENKSPLVLFASLLVGLAAYGAALPETVTWSDLTTVQNVFSFLGTIGAVLAAWLGKSPLTK